MTKALPEEELFYSVLLPKLVKAVISLEFKRRLPAICYLRVLGEFRHEEMRLTGAMVLNPSCMLLSFAELLKIWCPGPTFTEIVRTPGVVQSPGISGNNWGWEPLDHTQPLVFHQGSSDTRFENICEGLRGSGERRRCCLGCTYTPRGITRDQAAKFPGRGSLTLHLLLCMKR